MARPRTATDDEILAAARACLTEFGPGAPLSVMARRVGLSAGALVKRFGSKERLVFRALLPDRPPPWRGALAVPPGAALRRELADILASLSEDFFDLGPAFAALRMGGGTADLFPEDEEAPSLRVRRLLAAWLARAGAREPTDALADALVGAAEARGFLRWVHPRLVAGEDEAWAASLATWALPDAAPLPPDAEPG